VAAVLTLCRPVSSGRSELEALICLLPRFSDFGKGADRPLLLACK
jgi:hypothetical protein